MPVPPPLRLFDYLCVTHSCATVMVLLELDVPHWKLMAKLFAAVVSMESGVVSTVTIARAGTTELVVVCTTDIHCANRAVPVAPTVKIVAVTLKMKHAGPLEMLTIVIAPDVSTAVAPK